MTENNDLSDVVTHFSTITEAIIHTNDFETFCSLMQQHEALLSDLLLQPPIQQSYPDFKGQLKSLGAWGGDFMLAMSDKGVDYVKQYFADKGLK
ncbi:hypothetical protein RZS08_33850, partial [Arthrospira platensis SPKY1]|nr:hypothetical protein [Arthrospira platensis SPKY1]